MDKAERRALQDKLGFLEQEMAAVRARLGPNNFPRAWRLSLLESRLLGLLLVSDRVSRKALLSEFPASDAPRPGNALTVAISRIRKKVPVIILSVNSFGYSMPAEAKVLVLAVLTPPAKGV